MQTEQEHPPTHEAIASSAVPGAAAPWQLAVLGGLHGGAVVDVSADDWTLVGSAEDCDVVLRDPSVRAHHAALFPRGGRLQLRAIDGEVQTAGQTHAPGSTVMLDDAAAWQIDGVALGVGRAGSAAWAQLLAQPAAVVAPAPLLMAQDPDAPPEPTPADESAADETPASPPPPRRSMRRVHQWAAGAAACAVLLGIGTVAWGVIWQKVQARESSAAIAATLSGLGLPELRVVEAANGHQRIEGTVRSETERAKLMQALLQRGIYPAVDVVSGEQLAGTVQNSFRQRGVFVKASYAGNGRVEVLGAAPSALTEQVVQEVLAATNAVTQVALLDAAAAEPSAEPTAAPAAPPTPATAAANPNDRDPKRIVGVVGGLDPYVVTQDRKRYLVGSMLPDGTQVDQIDGDTVFFSRQGKPMPVKF
jgi:type III secretion protein D